MSNWDIAWQVVSLSSAFGGLGGLAAFFIGEEHTEERGAPATFWDGLISAFIGAVGAVGFIFFTIAVSDFSAALGLEEILRILSTSVIAGFGARRLLPKMVNSLEDKLRDTNKRIEETNDRAQVALEKMAEAEKHIAEMEEQAEKTAKEVREEARQNQRLKVNINLREAATKTASAILRREAVEEAEALIEDRNASSATWVALARVHRWNGKLETALVTLDRGLKAMMAGDVDKMNLAALYYNRGCYRALLHTPNTSDQEKHKALSDLDLFFENADDPAHEANIISGDADWERFADDGDFKAIVGKWSS